MIKKNVLRKIQRILLPYLSFTTNAKLICETIVSSWIKDTCENKNTQIRMS
jgi:hypothetical protein